MSDLFSKRILIVMGKGGVGKSLVSAALARAAVDRGKRVMLVQVNTKDKISGYLGCQPIDEDLKEVQPNLFAVNINPAAALKEYVVLQVRLEFIYRIVFENKAVRYFLRAVPALNDFVVLGKIFYHLEQVDKKTKKPLYDLIIVDAPATGHGLFLLRMPRTMSSVVSTGPIHREATKYQQILQDPEQCAINLVAIPEEMPVAETAEMFSEIRDNYNMPLGFLFVNSIFPSRFAPEEEGRIERMEKIFGPDSRLSPLIRVARTVIARRRMCEHYLRELSARVPLPQVRLPYLFTDRFDASVTADIAERIENELEDYKNGT